MYQEIVINKGSRLPGNHFNPAISFYTITFILLFSAPNKFPVRKSRSLQDFEKSIFDKINRNAVPLECVVRDCAEIVSFLRAPGAARHRENSESEEH